MAVDLQTVDGRTRWMALGALLGLSACSRTERVFISTQDVPPEVVRIALVATDPDTTPSGTGLYPPGELNFEVFSNDRPDRDLWLVGYRQDQLPELSDEVLRGSRLALADPTEPTLPTPHWSRRGLLRGESYELVESDAPPLLTVSWQSCPLAAADLLVNVRCHPCGQVVRPRAVGCAVELDVSECQIERDTVQLEPDPSGELRLDPAMNPGCTQLPTEAHSLATFECSLAQAPRICRFDVMLRSEELPSTVRVLSKQLISEPFPELDPVDRLVTAIPGFVSDLALVEDRVVAAVQPGAPSAWYCDDPRPGRLDILDAETLEPVVTATVEPCLYLLAAEPGAPRFYAAYGEQGVKLGEFDLSGRKLREVDLSAQVPFTRSRAVEIEIPDESHVELLVSRSIAPEIGVERPTSWLRLRRDTLEVTASHVFPSFFRVLRYSTSGQRHVLEPLDGAIMRIDEQGVEVVESYRSRCARTTIRVADFLQVDDEGFILASRHTFPYFFSLAGEAEGECLRDASFELLADPATFIPWRDGRFLAVVVARDAERRSYLVELDPTRVRLLPGMLELARGPVRFGGVDARGRVFGVAPGDGRVFRIDPP